MWQTDWTYGLIGGLMIGLAGVVLLAANGRIMGASGILGGLVDGAEPADLRERMAFIAALIGVPAFAALVWGAPHTHATTNLALLVIAGLLVGVGTRIGNGCTSGHGVCGMSRFSMRSIVATLFYLFAGGATMLVARHILGFI
jgi:uncharacterized membrane protein YedE/YeeE